MIRRLVLGAIAAPVILRTALAQNPAGQGVVSAQQPPANEAQAAMLGGMAFALATAQLAERQAESPALKAFAQLEVEEQTAFTTARQAAGLRVPTVELMPEERRQTMIRMRDLRGQEFDRAFLQAQIAGHQELLRLHQQVAQNPTSREEGLLATVAVPAIRTHLVVLQGVQATARG
jgi:putative membrane protein